MQKKVCMVVPSFSAKGGIATVVSGYRGSELEKQYNIKYIESYCDGNKVKKIFKAVTAYFMFLKEIVFNRPDLVHIHSSFGGSFFRKLPFIYIAHFMRIPIINHIHGADFETFYVNASSRKKEIIKNAYKKCAKVIVLSEEWKDKISLILPKKNICIIENYSYINYQIIDYRSKKNNYNTVLFLGFICQRKGCFDIPDVVRRVVEIIPDVRFILAGDGDFNAVKQLIDSSIEENVIFPGWVRNNEKEKYLYEADVFFLPSYNEGMPMCILDAMGCGLPIVSTTVGGISKIVWQGINGFIHQPGDKDGMAKSIIEILTNENIRKNFGHESKKIAEQHFSLEKHIKQISNIYEEL